jgi:hypothetical protein
MKRLIYSPFAYSQPGSGSAWCWLYVVEIRGVCYVIFSEDRDYRGPSITNGIEFAIREYHRKAEMNRWPECAGLVYVEHYDEQPGVFDLVTLRADGTGPDWRTAPDPLAWDLVEALGIWEGICLT